MILMGGLQVSVSEEQSTGIQRQGRRILPRRASVVTSFVTASLVTRSRSQVRSILRTVESM